MRWFTAALQTKLQGLISTDCDSLQGLFVLTIKSSAFQTKENEHTGTLFFHKITGYKRLARKIAIANLGGPVKLKNKLKGKKGKEKEGKLQF